MQEEKRMLTGMFSPFIFKLWKEKKSILYKDVLNCISSKNFDVNARGEKRKYLKDILLFLYVDGGRQLKSDFFF